MPLQWWLLLSLLCWFLLVALLSDYRRLGCRPGSSLSRTALGISSPHTLCITNKPGPVALNNTPFSIQLLWVRSSGTAEPGSLRGESHRLQSGLPTGSHPKAGLEKNSFHAHHVVLAGFSSSGEVGPRAINTCICFSCSESIPELSSLM